MRYNDQVSSDEVIMGMNCMKAEWKGKCCCNCQHQRVIVKHPWNEGAGKGCITEQMGFGCEAPDFYKEDGTRMIVFFDGGHGLCEMHDLAAKKEAGMPTTPRPERAIVERSDAGRAEAFS